MAMTVTTAEMVEAPEVRGWIAELVAASGGWRRAIGRAAGGLCLAAIFGLALGAREGGSSFLWHALGVPAGPALILALGVPALYIAIASFDVPLNALDLAHCAARGTAACGMVLGGLAPLTALYVVSSGNWVTAMLAAFSALLFAGIVGIINFHGALRAKLSDAPIGKRSVALTAATIFSVFTTIAAARMWLGELPIFLAGAK
jgi:hypothetical protein